VNLVAELQLQELRIRLHNGVRVRVLAQEEVVDHWKKIEEVVDH
jgi:hypothetical protein